jgi:hypothetical protein
MYSPAVTHRLNDNDTGDTENPSGKPSKIALSKIMLELAKRRNHDQGPTGDVQAAFREGERAPVAGASE